MYLRTVKVPSSSGKINEYVRIVEAYRENGKARQRVVADLGRKDVLIVFDIRRYQDDVVRFSQEAAALGADIVLFTDHWLSPIAAAARHVFALRTTLPSSWESFAALSALTEVMVARPQELNWGDASQRMEQLEKIRNRLKSG